MFRLHARSHDSLQGLPESVAGNDHDDIFDILQGIVQPGGDFKRFGEGHPRQVTAVAAFARHGADFLALDTPHDGRPPGAGELDGQRRAPRSGAEHGNAVHATRPQRPPQTIR